jgi:hypothetical protein
VDSKKNYEKILVLVAAHGQIVDEDYGVRDVITAEERRIKGHYVLLDSNVLTIPLTRTLRRMDPRRVVPEVKACFNVPHYRDRRTDYLHQVIRGERHDYIDYSQKLYKTCGYGDFTLLENTIRFLVDPSKSGGSCNYAVSVFLGRADGTRPTKEGYR